MVSPQNRTKLFRPPPKEDEILLDSPQILSNGCPAPSGCFRHLPLQQKSQTFCKSIEQAESCESLLCTENLMNEVVERCSEERKHTKIKMFIHPTSCLFFNQSSTFQNRKQIYCSSTWQYSQVLPVNFVSCNQTFEGVRHLQVHN